MIRRRVRRFLYWMGFKRFRNGRFTREEQLVRAKRRSQQLWNMSRDGLASLDDLEEYANLKSWIEFLEGEIRVRS